MKNSTKLEQKPDVPEGSVAKTNDARGGKHKGAEKGRCGWRQKGFPEEAEPDESLDGQRGFAQVQKR